MDIIRRQSGAEPDSAGLARFQDGLFEALLDRVPMPFQRPVVAREDYLAIGDYRPECLLWDCDWALRAALHGECALLDEGLYLQRAAGQGYSSQGHRALEHTRSNLEIKESLLRHPAAVEPGRQRALLRALHRGWLDYCWQLRQRGEWREAEDALRKSARFGLSGSFLKMLAAAVLRRLGIGKRRPASA